MNMTLEEKAKHIAKVANERCHRSDGYEEDIYKLALVYLKEAYEMGDDHAREVMEYEF